MKRNVSWFIAAIALLTIVWKLSAASSTECGASACESYDFDDCPGGCAGDPTCTWVDYGLGGQPWNSSCWEAAQLPNIGCVDLGTVAGSEGVYAINHLYYCDGNNCEDCDWGRPYWTIILTNEGPSAACTDVDCAG